MPEKTQQRRRIMVEFAQPNTHKDFHVGHLRNASIGQAIANLLEHAGHEVYKATYIGDVGAHVAKAIMGIQFCVDQEAKADGFYSDVPDSSKSPLEYYGYLYKETTRWIKQSKESNEIASADLVKRYATLSSELAEQNSVPAIPKGEFLEQVCLVWLLRWEDKEESARDTWKKSRDECVAEFRKIFKELLLSFTEDPDCWFYESTVDDTKLGQGAAKELLDRGIAEVDESEEYKGAVFVDFEKHADSPLFRDDERKRIRKLGKMTILRSDGTSLYQTKELGLAKYKFDLIREKTGHELEESLYVVGAEQTLYFEQVLAILRLWGFPNAENCRHIAYALVVLPEGKMSSREGSIVSYRELRDEAVKRAEETIREKGIIKDAKQAERTAKQIAIAAIKFAMLQVTGTQQIVFDFEQALSFSGRAAPYIQYAYARAGKLIEHSDVNPTKADSPSRGTDSPSRGAGRDARPTGKEIQAEAVKVPEYELNGSEIELARQISLFPSTIESAASNYEPATLCSYLYSLASAFSDFYRDCRVLDAPDAEKEFRSALVASFRQVVRTGFKILALPLPEEM